MCVRERETCHGDSIVALLRGDIDINEKTYFHVPT